MRIVRFEVRPVAGRVGDRPPLLGIALDVTLRADLVRHRRVRGDLVGVLDNTPDSHLAALQQIRPVTGLAAQVLVCAPTEALERLLHEVARHAEVVVVLHVVVRAIGVVPAARHADGQEPADQGQRRRGQPAHSPSQRSSHPSTLLSHGRLRDFRLTRSSRRFRRTSERDSAARRNLHRTAEYAASVPRSLSYRPG